MDSRSPDHRLLPPPASSSSLWSPVALMHPSVKGAPSLHRSSPLTDHHLMNLTSLRTTFDGRQSAPPAAHQSSAVPSMTLNLPPPPSHQYLRVSGRPSGSLGSSSVGSLSAASSQIPRSSSHSTTSLTQQHKSGSDGNFLNNNTNNSSSQSANRGDITTAGSMRSRGDLPRSPFSSSCPRTIRGDHHEANSAAKTTPSIKSTPVSLGYLSSHPTHLPPHIYSTIGASYPLNGHPMMPLSRTNGHASSPPGHHAMAFPTPSPSPHSASGTSSKSNFMNVDSLISKSSSTSSLASTRQSSPHRHSSLNSSLSSSNRGHESNNSLGNNVNSRPTVVEQSKEPGVMISSSGQWTNNSKSYPQSSSVIQQSFMMPPHHHFSGHAMFSQQPPVAHSSSPKNNNGNNSHFNENAMNHKQATKEMLSDSGRLGSTSNSLNKIRLEAASAEQSSLHSKKTSSAHTVLPPPSSRHANPFMMANNYLSNSTQNTSSSTTSSSHQPAHYSFPQHLPGLPHPSLMYTGQGMPNLSLHHPMSGQPSMTRQQQSVISSNKTSQSTVQSVMSRSCDNINEPSAPSSKSQPREPLESMSASTFAATDANNKSSRNHGSEARSSLKRKEPNDNSSEGPLTSVSPSGSTTSNNSNSGGAKFLKKFWVQKYQDTKTNDGSPAPPASTNDPTTAVQNGLSSPSLSSKDAGKVIKKEKVNGSSSKKSKKIPKKPDKNNKNNKGSESLASGSETEDDDSESSGKKKTTTTKKTDKKTASSKKNVPTANSTTSGKKRGSSTASGKEKKVKKIKSSHHHDETAHQTPAKSDDSTSGVKGLVNSSSVVESKASSETSNDSKSKKDKMIPKKGTALAAARELMPDSDVTEDEADDSSSLREEKETTSTTTTGKKRGRKPKSESSGKSSPTNSHSKTKKSKKSNKQEEEDDTTSTTSQTKTKKSKKEQSYLETVDKSGKAFLQDKSCSEVAPKSSKDSSSLLPKCRECRMTAYQKIKKDVGPSIFCRFYQFRKLVFDKDLKAAGFSQPKDAKEEDFKLWLPPDKWTHPDLILKKVDAQFLIDFVGDHFCNLVAQEAKALSIHLGSTNSIAWKSVVAGVREMCDVCETTLFNIHWVCSECGFVVCIDCYKTKRDDEALTKESINRSKTTNQVVGNKNSTSNGSSNLNVKNNDKKSGENNNNGNDHQEPSDSDCLVSPSSPKANQETKHPSSSHGLSKDTDRFGWLHCNSKLPHDQEKLILTQIIAKTALWDVCARLHAIKARKGNPCTCNNDQIVNLLVNRSKTTKEVNIDNKQHTKVGSLDSKVSIVKQEPQQTPDNLKSETSHANDSIVKKEPPLKQETKVTPDSGSDASCSSQEAKKNSDLLTAKDIIKTDEEEEEDVTAKNFSALRELLSKSVPEEVKTTEPLSCEPKSLALTTTGKKGRGSVKKPPVLSTQLNGVIKNCDDQFESTSLQYFSRRITPIFVSKNLPPRVCTLEETSKQFCDIPHDWFCNGRLLLLKDTGVEKNLKLFEQQWIRHQV